MAKIVPYIFVKNGLRTIESYKELFGAKLISHQKFEPQVGKYMGFPDDFNYEESTMHAVLDIMGAQVFLSDGRMNIVPEGSVEVMLEVDSKDDIEGIWKGVREKGFKIIMDLGKNLSGSWHGRFVDSDGIGWMTIFQEEPL